MAEQVGVHSGTFANAIQSLDGVFQAKKAIGTYYTNTHDMTQTRVVGNSNPNLVTCYPINVPKQTNYDRYCFRTNGASAGSLIRAGLYDSDNNAKPRNLILDIGEINTAVGAVYEIPIALTLSPGLYFFGRILNALRSVYLVSGGTQLSHLGFPDVLTASSYIAWTVAQAYGPLPNPFPAAGALASSALNHLVMLRVAA